MAMCRAGRTRVLAKIDRREKDSLKTQDPSKAPKKIIGTTTYTFNYAHLHIVGRSKMRQKQKKQRDKEEKGAHHSNQQDRIEQVQLLTSLCNATFFVCFKSCSPLLTRARKNSTVTAAVMRICPTITQSGSKRLLGR